jgi:hypothetical protein
MKWKPSEKLTIILAGILVFGYLILGILHIIINH